MNKQFGPLGDEPLGAVIGVEESGAEEEPPPQPLSKTAKEQSDAAMETLRRRIFSVFLN